MHLYRWTALTSGKPPALWRRCHTSCAGSRKMRYLSRIGHQNDTLSNCSFQTGTPVQVRNFERGQLYGRPLGSGQRTVPACKSPTSAMRTFCIDTLTKCGFQMVRWKLFLVCRHCRSQRLRLSCEDLLDPGKTRNGFPTKEGEGCCDSAKKSRAR